MDILYIVLTLAFGLLCIGLIKFSARLMDGAE